MSERNRRLASLLLTLGLLGGNLVAFNVLLGGWSGARLDLTEDGEFSITPATRRVLDSLDEDLTIHGYFSKRTHPKLAPLVPEIADLLDEYRAVSRGRVQVEIIDPGEDTEAEEAANERFGVRSTPFQLASKYETGIVNAYFALVVRYGDRYERYGFSDLIEIVPLPDGDVEVRLRNLEYDLTRAIKKVTSEMRGGLDLFDALDQPVVFTAIVTPGSLPEIFAGAPEAIRTAAEELSEAGGDSFRYEEIDPTTDEATQELVYREFGARPMSVGLFGDESFFLYGFLEAGGRLEQLVLTDGDLSAADIREAIEQSLRRYTPGLMKTVGVVAPDPSIPPEVMMQLQMQGRMPPTPPPEFEEIQRYLERDYNVRRVSLDGDEGVPYDVDLLLVLKPRELGDRESYNLDQYLMRGGRVVLCSGRFDVQLDRSGLSVLPMATGLEDWLAHNGITVEPTMVLDDRNQALPIPEVRQTAIGQIQTWVMAPYPYLVHVQDEGFVNGDVAATLEAVGIYWGSPITVDEEATGGLEVTPILQSSELSWTSGDTSLVNFVDYVVPEEGTEPRLLAAALSGRFESFFAGKEVPRAARPDTSENESEAEAPTAVTLEASPETRLVVVGNAEFLSDFVARALGNLDGGFFLENLRFMENLIDWATQDNDMIAIRSRGVANRRLARTEKPQQVSIEVVNYLIPAALLLALAAWRYWSRRNAVPMFDRPGGKEVTR
jgi:ABC-2 type transport system permease protein